MSESHISAYKHELRLYKSRNSKNGILIIRYHDDESSKTLAWILLGAFLIMHAMEIYIAAAGETFHLIRCFVILSRKVLSHNHQD